MSGYATPKAHNHNHIWREGPMPTEEKSKDALLASIIRCGTVGRWLRGEEIAWGAELEAEGKVSLCCGGEAATFEADFDGFCPQCEIAMKNTTNCGKLANTEGQTRGGSRVV